MIIERWFRECQECRHIQETTHPPKSIPAFDIWSEIKCNKCGSPALDYGQNRDFNTETQTFVEYPEDDE